MQASQLGPRELKILLSQYVPQPRTVAQNTDTNTAYRSAVSVSSIGIGNSIMFQACISSNKNFQTCIGISIGKPQITLHL